MNRQHTPKNRLSETAANLDEIGRAFKLSRERIRQIERETMAKLRHPSRARSLRDYLDD